MTPFEFWAIVIIGGSAVTAMMVVALRMIWQQRGASALSRPQSQTGEA